MSLTMDDVRNVQFGRPPLGRRGYHERDVDRFLDTVVETLAGAGELTVADVHNVEFSRPLIRPGYDERQVDAFLDTVAAQLLAQPERERAHGVG